MPLSYIAYPGNGSTKDFGVPFPYLRQGHVKVYINYDYINDTFASELSPDTGFLWTSDTTIQTAAPVASGSTLTIIRKTPNQEQLVFWQDGSNRTSYDLNTADQQNLYVVQEQQDRNEASVIATATATATAAASAQAAQNAAAAASGAADDAVAAAGGAVAAANGAVATANNAEATANNAVATANNAVLGSLSSIEAAAISLNASFSIGRPGATPFGVGPYVPLAPAIAGASQQDYNPIHVASGSFI